MDTSQVTPAESTRKPGLLINRNFALLWSGQSISVIGDAIFTTTLILWIATSLAKNQSWAPLAVSGIFLAMSVPTMVAGPIAGVFADRWDKRRTMLQMDATRALLVLLLLLVAILPFKALIAWQLTAIYSFVALMNICTQFFNPSRFSLIGAIVEKPQLARASGLSQTVNSLATIIGPPLATLLFFQVGVQWALLLNALSFVASFFAILLIHAPHMPSPTTSTQKNPFFSELNEGIRFSLRSRVLVTLAITGVLITLGSGALSALGIFFVTQNLHASAQVFGFLNSAYGVGAIAGAMVTGLLAQRLGIIRTFCLSVLLAGVALLLYARLTDLTLALIVVFLIGILISAVNVVVAPLVLQTTPQELIGRASSVLGLVLSLAAALSFTLAGYLDSVVLRDFHTTAFGMSIGPVDTIYMGTAILVIASGLYALFSLQRITLSAKPAPQPVATAEQ